MLRLTGDRIYSIEKIGDLIDKFRAAKVRLADLSAPDAKLKLVVSAERVRQVEPSDPQIFHKDAKSILDFGSRVFLAVRELPDEARQRPADLLAAVTASLHRARALVALRAERHRRYNCVHFITTEWHRTKKD